MRMFKCDEIERNGLMIFMMTDESGPTQVIIFDKKNEIRESIRWNIQKNN